MSKIGKGCTQNIIGSVEVSNFEELCQCIAESLAAGIELAGVEVGCAVDANGSVIGKVFLTKQLNEDGTGEINILSAVLFDDGSGSPGIVTPYTGAMGVCAAGAMQVVTLEELCVLVDGIPTAATPVSVIDPILGVVTNTIYLDALGSLITGVVTENLDPCSCGCVECPPSP